LTSPAGKPFAEKGKGYDDACYLTSAVLRNFMPRGYTSFTFTNEAGDQASVVLRGFLKFTGITATDEDEESGATAEVDAFMFHGFTRADASRFAVTTKSNGENGKYTFRRVFGEWYAFAGSKNTGSVWRVASDATELYPIPADAGSTGAAQVGPKIIKVLHDTLKAMAEDKKLALLEAVDAAHYTVMIELNDPTHEHIFPIPTLMADHVAVLSRTGFPLPQRDAYALFDTHGLTRVACDMQDDMTKLEAVVEEIRARTDVEGAVIYLERQDDQAVGLVKVKSDHYVIARRTREILRGALVVAVGKGTSTEDAMKTASSRLRKGMKELKHVSGCAEKHEAWSEFAVGFAQSWADAYKEGNAATKKALVNEFHGRYGTLYFNFYEAWQKGDRGARPKLLIAG